MDEQLCNIQALPPEIGLFYRELRFRLKFYPVLKLFVSDQFLGFFNVHPLVAALRKAFERENGLLMIAGMAIPTPSWRIANPFAQCFIDIIFPFMAGSDFDLFNEGPYEYREQVRMRSGDVVIDCGANFGHFSALAAHRGCRVYAFEPIDSVRKFSLDRIAHIYPAVTIIPYALLDRKRETFFAVHYLDSHMIGDISESIPPDVVPGKKQQRVTAISLDEFVAQEKLERVDFIKADIEGAERLMLAGAQNTIRKCSPNISICTYHRPDDPAVLKNLLLDLQPRYAIIEKYKKMYAYVEK